MSEVKHNVAQSRFEVDVEGETAVADYEIEGNRMLFTHTWVPGAARGKGIAAQLVKAGLEYAREKKLEPVPLCSYVVTYMRRNDG